MNGRSTISAARRGRVRRSAPAAAACVCIITAAATTARAQNDPPPPQTPVQPRGEMIQRADSAKGANAPAARHERGPLNVIISESLQQLVQQLDAPSYEEREHATDQLVNSALDLQQVQALLASNTLSLEQRHRLLSAARQHLLFAPRGALGISMLWFQTEPGESGEVEVRMLLPDLPAERVLQIGDRIRAMDGRELHTQNDLIRFAQLHRPGDRVELSIRRIARDEKGAALRDANNELVYEDKLVTLELGSADMLLNADGSVQRRGPVVEDREREAIILLARYGTAARKLELDPQHRLAPSNVQVAMAAGSFSDAQVEQHRYIAELLREKKYIRNGAAREEQYRTVWQQRIADLQAQASDSGMAEDDRRYLRKVLQRYLEIMRDE